MSAGYTTALTGLDALSPNVPNDFSIPRWYAAYTNANHEKRVAQHLGLRGVEHFLPLCTTVSQWKDRRVTLQRPLFPGYVFVCIALGVQRAEVQTAPGIARLVGVGGSPTPLAAEEIEALQMSLTVGLQWQPYPFFTVGRRVQVISGPLRGLRGRIVKHKSKGRFVISVTLIQRAVSVELDGLDLRTVTQESEPAQCMTKISWGEIE